MTSSTRTRVTCPVCDHRVGVGRRGRLARHLALFVVDGVNRVVDCPGGGRRPEDAQAEVTR